MVKKQKVEVYLATNYCDLCGGSMTSEGYALMSNPPQYVYKCNECGNTIFSTETYPKVEYIHKRTILEKITSWFNPKK